MHALFPFIWVEGELEEEWLKEAGLSTLFGEAAGDSHETMVVLATLTRTQAIAVQKRVDTITQTMRKKNKQYQVPDVREIFKQQNESMEKVSSWSGALVWHFWKSFLTQCRVNEKWNALFSVLAKPTAEDISEELKTKAGFAKIYLFIYLKWVDCLCKGPCLLFWKCALFFFFFFWGFYTLKWH